MKKRYPHSVCSCSFSFRTKFTTLPQKLRDSFHWALTMAAASWGFSEISQNQLQISMVPRGWITMTWVIFLWCHQQIKVTYPVNDFNICWMDWHTILHRKSLFTDDESWWHCWSLTSPLAPPPGWHLWFYKIIPMTASATNTAGRQCYVLAL